MRTVKSFKCPACGKVYQSLATWSNHVEKMHKESIPKGYTPARYFYYLQTGKTGNKCIVCKKPTEWNEASQKYERFCRDPQCKDTYREMFKNRMVSKYGKVHLLNDPQRQRDMLMKRKTSGLYKFSDGIKIGYASSYEKDFLHMLDVFLHFSGNDIMGPSPHTYYYDYKNPDDVDHEGRHFYIPDYFIPSLNLEIEIKQNTNTHPKLLKIDRVKELQKDAIFKDNDTVNYIKIVEKDYTKFFELLLNLKNRVPVGLKDDGEASVAIALESSRDNSSNVDEEPAMESIIGTEIEFRNERLLDRNAYAIVYTNDTEKFYSDYRSLRQIKLKILNRYKNVETILIEPFAMHAKPLTDLPSYLLNIIKSTGSSKRDYYGIWTQILSAIKEYTKWNKDTFFFIIASNAYMYAEDDVYTSPIIRVKYSGLHQTMSAVKRSTSGIKSTINDIRSIEKTYHMTDLVDQQTTIQNPEKLILYHISMANNLTHLEPRPCQSAAKYENIATPRISAAASIDRCVHAIQKYTGCVKYSVYQLQLQPSTRVLQPSVKLVPDVIDTSEYWVLDPVRIKKISDILVYNRHGDNYYQIYSAQQDVILLNNIHQTINMDIPENTNGDMIEIVVSPHKKKDTILKALLDIGKREILSILTDPSKLEIVVAFVKWAASTMQIQSIYKNALPSSIPLTAITDKIALSVSNKAPRVKLISLEEYLYNTVDETNYNIDIERISHNASTIDDDASNASNLKDFISSLLDTDI